MTKTNTLGFVGSFPIPEVVRNINAFTLGAKSVNPKIKTKVIWVNTWYDPAKERQAAETLVAQGADVHVPEHRLPCHRAGRPGEGRLRLRLGFGHGRSSRPKAHLSANTNNWGVYYIATVKKILAGTWKPEEVKWGLKEGLVVMSPVNPVVPAAGAKAFEDKKKAMIDGKFQPFQGPVKDQSGKVKVAAGKTMPMDDADELQLVRGGRRRHAFRSKLNALSPDGGAASAAPFRFT